jgi:hypothetical protein
MNGRAIMRIENLTIEKVGGITMRKIASHLLKSSDDDCYLVFIQKFDKDIEPAPNSMTSVMFK